MKKGIDVSQFNGEIDWKRVKESGRADFAILRSGFGWTDGDMSLRRDRMFERNVKGCEEAGIPYGIYHYSYCVKPENARKEAKYALQLIKAAGAKPIYPVWLDIEDSAQISLGRDVLTQIALDWLDEAEQAGYYAGIYSYRAFLQNYLDMSRLAKYDVWLAEVDVEKPKYTGDYGMWQYSWKGKIDGIAGDVDLDYAYRDYPEIIRQKGLNGWEKTPDNELEKIKAELAEIIERLIGLQARLKARGQV